jgi:hypothetical protein
MVGLGILFKKFDPKKNLTTLQQIDPEKNGR